MARTKQIDRKSTGGRAPAAPLSQRAGRITAPGSQSNGLAPGEHWVAHVIDKRMHRRNELDTESEEYFIIWWKRHGRQPRTWTKRSLLLAGGPKTELALVDDWCGVAGCRRTSSHTSRATVPLRLPQAP